ncbi:hypothetical protein, partial [Enterobacter hormaechei]|uniref:hypothetical protein n=1 Tax=Enterobacter hormaechei TaxID=158836 RepID=UPI0013D5171D
RVPAVAESVLAGPAKDAIGERRCAEAGEADKRRLLVRRGRAASSVDLRRQSDRRDVVPRATAPGRSETSPVDEPDVLSLRYGSTGRCGR